MKNVTFQMENTIFRLETLEEKSNERNKEQRTNQEKIIHNQYMSQIALAVTIINSLITIVFGVFQHFLRIQQ